MPPLPVARTNPNQTPFFLSFRSLIYKLFPYLALAFVFVFVAIGTLFFFRDQAFKKQFRQLSAQLANIESRLQSEQSMGNDDLIDIARELAEMEHLNDELSGKINATAEKLLGVNRTEKTK